MITKLIWILHIILVLYLLITPLLPNILMKINILIIIFVHLHWYLLNKECILALFHLDLESNSEFSYNPPEFVVAILVYIVLLISFYKINELKLGIIIVLIFLIINKKLYDNIIIPNSDRLK